MFLGVSVCQLVCGSVREFMCLYFYALEGFCVYVCVSEFVSVCKCEGVCVCLYCYAWEGFCVYACVS